MTEHLLSAPVPRERDLRNISNSEVATWLTCERKYYYEFDLALEPRVAPTALGRGILLHETLAVYYEALKAGESHATAVMQARSALLAYMTKQDIPLDVVTEVDRLLQGYWNRYQGDPDWTIVAVEKSYDLPLTDDYQYSLRLDLLVRENSTGHLVLVDHKTAYDFWSEDDLDLNPQFPKYIGSLRANGIMVDKAVLNQIRTRKLKNPGPDDLFRRTVCMPSRTKVANALREQVLASEEIVKHRLLPVEVRSKVSKRNLNKMVCRSCSVKNLCMFEYDGSDITHEIANNYKPRTYGYNDPSTEEL